MSESGKFDRSSHDYPSDNKNKLFGFGMLFRKRISHAEKESVTEIYYG